MSEKNEGMTLSLSFRGVTTLGLPHPCHSGLDPEFSMALAMCIRITYKLEIRTCLSGKGVFTCGISIFMYFCTLFKK